MPSARQLLTNPIPKGGNATTGLGVFTLGSADYSALRAMYPGSPAYDGTYDDDHVISTYNQLNVSPINDGGYYFGTFNLDFSDAPDLTTVKTGGGGLPGTPYSPNTASPGPGLNPKNIPAIDPAILAKDKGGGGFGVGDGLASPNNTSKVISRQKIGNLILGSSTPRG
jgi:hypothetical protein